MIELHRNNGQLVAADLLANSDRALGDSPALPICKTRSERRLITPQRVNDSYPEKSGYLSWEMLLIWGFVVFSFAAFFFCLWAISAKVRGECLPELSEPIEKHNEFKSIQKMHMKKRTRNERMQTNEKAEPAATQPGLPATKMEQIQRRAYEIFEARGGEPGSALDDWLLAEHGLKAESNGARRSPPSQATPRNPGVIPSC